VEVPASPQHRAVRRRPDRAHGQYEQRDGAAAGTKDEALKIKLRGEVDLQTYRTVTRELDAAHDQLAREHKSLTSEAAMPELPDPSLAWENLSAELIGAR
jgi:hypothetical protein